MGYETILYEKREGLAVLTMNRPQVLNAHNTRMREEIAEVLDDARRDPSVAVVIYTGAGRAFSAGNDLKERVQNQAVEQHPTESRRFPHFRAESTFDKPLIAAVNGPAYAGGTERALMCDIIIASERASFALMEVKRGLLASDGVQRLARLVGKNLAMEMILTGDPIDAQEAYRIGLANRVVPHEELMPAAEEMARRILANAPVAVRMAKEAVRRGLEVNLEEGLRLSADLATLLHTTEDSKEGPRAFVEKRAPRWKGR